MTCRKQCPRPKLAGIGEAAARLFVQEGARVVIGGERPASRSAGSRTSQPRLLAHAPALPCRPADMQVQRAEKVAASLGDGAISKASFTRLALHVESNVALWVPQPR